MRGFPKRFNRDFFGLISTLITFCSYWDKEYDLELMSDPVALNLLYIQAVSDIERGWTFCTRETKTILANLQVQLAKKEYIELARSQKHYGFIQFTPCYCDYPHQDTKVLISIGDQELNMRIVNSGQFVKEGSFKVTRMRCWRITATHVITKFNYKQ